MKKLLTNKYFILLTLAIVFFGIKSYIGSRNLTPLTINNITFKVEKAETLAEKTLGLMYRQSLKKDRGMLFVYPQEQYASFWMKNTYIPLDIIWIDANKKIVDISKDAQPCTTEDCPSYATDNKIQYVLEINAGLSEEYGFKKGDQVVF